MSLLEIDHAWCQYCQETSVLWTSRAAVVPPGLCDIPASVGANTSLRARLLQRLTLIPLDEFSILITFSAPFIRTIYFLRAEDVNFGAFGWASPDFKSDQVLGYEFGTQVLKPLTESMILWGIGKSRNDLMFKRSQGSRLTNDTSKLVVFSNCLCVFHFIVHHPPPLGPRLGSFTCCGQQHLFQGRFRE